MDRFTALVARYRKPIVVVSLLLALLSGVSALFVPINYDLTAYLPTSAESTRALDEMNAEFDTAVPNARVMVNDVGIEEALTYKQRLSEVPSIQGVLWLDDLADLSVPLDMLDS
ncbi:MAG: RND family transporter, partial [Raoultibacter sp.]